LSDLHQILHRVASIAAACFQILKPEVELEIQNGGDGHLENTLRNNSAKYCWILMKFETQIPDIMFN